MGALAELRAAGLDVAALPGGRLKVTPAARLTDALRATVREHRAAILSELAAAPIATAAEACESPAPARMLTNADTGGGVQAPPERDMSAAAVRERFRQSAAALLADLEALPELTPEQAEEAAYYRSVVSPRPRSVPPPAPSGVGGSNPQAPELGTDAGSVAHTAAK